MQNVVLGRVGGAQGAMRLVGECAPCQNRLSAILWNNCIVCEVLSSEFVPAS